MTTLNDTEMNRPRGRPRENRALSTQKKPSKGTASKTPELYLVMTPMEPSAMEVDEQQPANKDFDRSREHKIEGDNRQYQAAMQSFIEDSLSKGKTKMKFEFVII